MADIFKEAMKDKFAENSIEIYESKRPNTEHKSRIV